MIDSREVEKNNIENIRHDELFKAIGELTKSMENLQTEFLQVKRSVDRFNEWTNNGSFLFKVVLGIGSLGMFMGGAYLMVRQILHGQN